MSRIAGFGYALAALGTVALFATLGTWQLGRGLAKQQRIAEESIALKVATPADLAAEAQREEAGAIVRIAGRGRYRAPLLLLDGQQRKGRVGLRVYALARLSTLSHAVLVDLGWVALPPDRRLPELNLPEGERELRGLLVPWPGQGLRLAPNPWPSDAAGPVLLTRLDRDEIQDALDIELAPRVLRLAPDLAYGYERDLDALPNTLPPERHFGYAAQWFGLALTVVVVYFVLSRRARRRRTTV